MEVLLNTKKITVEYNAKENYFYCNWKGYQNKQSIMEIGEQILTLFAAKKCSKILNDNTMVSGPWHEAAEWTVTNWFPRMEKAGLRSFAWIFSKDIFAELSAQKAMPASDFVKSFNDIAEAKSWLTDRKEEIMA